MMSIFSRAMRPALLLLVLFIAACDALVDLPSGPGLVIQDLSGNELVRVEGNTVRGSLQVPAGERLELRILLLDERGNPRALQPGESLRGVVTTSVLARLDTPAVGRAVLTGLRIGGTTVRFDLLSNAVSEHVFPLIPLQVI